MISNKTTEKLPYAVVLHIAYTGYGVVRSLTGFDIPIVAFQKDLSPAETKTRLCEKIITFNNDDELLHKMIYIAEKQSQKPVLFITSDVYVEFFIKNREIIENSYKIHYPNTDVVKLLLNKNQFIDYAQDNDLRIPKSLKVSSEVDLKNNIKDLIFPAIVKPFTKTDKWLMAKLDKAYLIDKPEELSNLYNKIKEIESDILVQEWIPGPDSNVEYCLTYFDGDSQCLAAFTGAKIRQWPVGTGSTASTKPIQNDHIRNETVRLFKGLSYRGFGSVEFKRHAENGMYYIMEPTVGRPNQQSYIATANGINMPLIAYNLLTGLNIGNNKNIIKEPIYYIDEWADIGSVLVHLIRGQNCLKEFLGLIKKKKEYRYFDKRDIMVFISSFMKLIIFCIKNVFRLSRRNVLKIPIKSLM